MASICNRCGKVKQGVATGICDHCGRFGKSPAEWWNSLSSASKTQLCDINPDIVGRVRRHETLTDIEVEKLYSAAMEPDFNNQSQK